MRIFVIVLLAIFRSSDQLVPDLQEILTSTGLLYHGLGMDDAEMLGADAEQIFAQWKQQGILYQASMTYVNEFMPRLATPVGVLLNPLDPHVHVHLLGEKDVYYNEAKARFPVSNPKLDQICLGVQGQLEADRAMYNAANWKYVSYIHTCYERMIANIDIQGVLKAAGIRYFSDEQILTALKDNNVRSRAWQRKGQAPLRSTFGPSYEHPRRLWNEVIVSAPITSIVAVIMWVEDPTIKMTPEGNGPKHAGFWFEDACKAAQQYNSEIPCYQIVDEMMFLRPGGTIPVDAQSSDEDSPRKKVRQASKVPNAPNADSRRPRPPRTGSNYLFDINSVPSRNSPRGGRVPGLAGDIISSRSDSPLDPPSILNRGSPLSPSPLVGSPISPSPLRASSSHLDLLAQASAQLEGGSSSSDNVAQFDADRRVEISSPETFKLGLSIILCIVLLTWLSFPMCAYGHSQSACGSRTILATISLRALNNSCFTLWNLKNTF